MVNAYLYRTLRCRHRGDDTGFTKAVKLQTYPHSRDAVSVDGEVLEVIGLLLLHENTVPVVRLQADLRHLGTRKDDWDGLKAEYLAKGWTEVSNVKDYKPSL